MASDWIGYLVRIPIVEGALASFLFWTVNRAWAVVGDVHNADDVSERTLGATVIMGQLSAVITGASIILAGVGAFAAIGSGRFLFPENWHLFYAAAWAVAALGTAVYTMGTLPTRTPTENFVRSRGVAVLCSAALFLCLASGARFLCAVGAIALFNR